MHDAQGRVTLDGFYNDVLPLSSDEREKLARYGLSDAEYCADLGLPSLWGEKDFSPVERLGAPAPPLKSTVCFPDLPARGQKRSSRSRNGEDFHQAGSNQDPEKIYGMLVDFLKEKCCLHDSLGT